ncbi:hypothetical protein E2C01_056030 [Portunus trituberculatus]|uniref:Uncharacterized protein n=1 Tax=Portunus trituberculatus TaxID=210409 RepID=A0A5B7GP93_PORTR|nr:hypothetical protein [Portunus trituberculatus]
MRVCARGMYLLSALISRHHPPSFCVRPSVTAQRQLRNSATHRRQGSVPITFCEKQEGKRFERTLVPIASV